MQRLIHRLCELTRAPEGCRGAAPSEVVSCSASCQSWSGVGRRLDPNPNFNPNPNFGPNPNPNLRGTLLTPRLQLRSGPYCSSCQRGAVDSRSVHTAAHGREGGGGRMRDKRPRGPCWPAGQSIDNMLQLRTPPARGGKIVGSLLEPVKTSTTIRRKALQFRPPLRATVPPNGSKTCTKQSFRSPTRSIHPRASREACHPGCVRGHQQTGAG